MPKLDIFYILPESDVEKAKIEIDKHMVIAPWLEESNKYRETYEKADGTKIIDNGAFETGSPMDINKYLDLAKLIRADYIIAPDITTDLDNYNEIFDEFYQKVSSKMGIMFPFPSYKRIWVNFCKDMCRQYNMIPALPKRPFRDNHYGHRNRMNVAVELRKYFEHVHCLGLDLSIELRDLRKFAGYITVDTSLPYKYSNVCFDYKGKYDTKRADFFRESIEKFAYLR